MQLFLFLVAWINDVSILIMMTSYSNDAVGFLCGTPMFSKITLLHSDWFYIVMYYGISKFHGFSINYSSLLYINLRMDLIPSSSFFKKLPFFFFFCYENCTFSFITWFHGLTSASKHWFLKKKYEEFTVREFSQLIWMNSFIGILTILLYIQVVRGTCWLEWNRASFITTDLIGSIAFFLRNKPLLQQNQTEYVLEINKIGSS